MRNYGIIPHGKSPNNRPNSTVIVALRGQNAVSIRGRNLTITFRDL
jgi:hypothetical protein